MSVDTEERRYYEINSLHKIFALSSTLLFCSIIWLLADDFTAEWKDWQKIFASLEEKRKGGGTPKLRNTPEYENKQSGDTLERPSTLSKTVAGYIRNFPFIDFINPSLKIEQVVLKDFSYDLKFSRSSRVDRCISCHIPMINSNYKEGEVPLKTHPYQDLFLSFDSPHPLQSFGCSVCHRGRDRGTSFNSSAHSPNTPEDEADWGERYKWKPLENWNDPMVPSRYIESSCPLCHENERILKGAAKLNEGRRLFEKLGCRGCHTVPGAGKFRKPGPSLRKISEKLNKDWVKSWISNPLKKNKHANMPLFFPSDSGLAKEEVSKRLDAIVEFLFSQSEGQRKEVPNFSGNAEKGLKLFETIGCTACHNAPGKESTQNARQAIRLSHLKEKVNREWLFTWLKDPKQFDPETLMPNFRLSDSEASDITEYLLSGRDESTNSDFLKGKSTSTGTRKIQNSIPEKPLKAVIELGHKLVSRYGCFGCHEIKGFDNSRPVGPDLSTIGSKPVKNFSFGTLRDEMGNSRHSWLFKKLENPRAFTDKKKGLEETLIMPAYLLSDDQINAIVTFLLGLTNETIPESRKRVLSIEENIRERAFRIIEKRRCLACHSLGGEGGDFGKSLPGADKRSSHLLPPTLDGEGAMVKPQWLFNFLKNPSTIRPWLKVRMPSFDLPSSEIDALVTFFSVLEGKRSVFDDTLPGNENDNQIRIGKDIFTRLKCNSCHKTPDVDNVSSGNIGPDLTLAKTRLRREWIKRWLEEPQKLKKGTRMPTNWIKVIRRGKTRYVLPPSLKDVFKGDVKKQISAVTAYLLTL